METLTLERTNATEAVKASDIFVPAEELEENARSAINDGTVKLTLIPCDSGEDANIRTYVNVGRDDVRTDEIPDAEQVYKSGPFEDFPWKKPDEILERAKEQSDNRLIESICYDNAWYLNEPKLEREISEENVSELFDIVSDSGEVTKLINFTDRKLSEEQLDRIRTVISKISDLCGDTVIKATNAICILKADRFGKTITGSARGLGGVILINEKIFNGDFNSELTEAAKQDIPTLEATLTHELAHLIELQDKEPNAFAAATGWNERNSSFVDDYGKVVQVSRSVLTVPLEIKIEKDGELKEVVALREYDTDIINSAGPVSPYGGKNSREDLAEAFIPYVHNERGDTKALDQIRRDAIGSLLRRVGSGEYGPLFIKLNRLPLTTKIGGIIKPKQYIVSEPIFTYSNPKNGDKPKQEPAVYIGTRNKVIDDYGNELSVYGRREPIP